MPCRLVAAALAAASLLALAVVAVPLRDAAVAPVVAAPVVVAAVQPARLPAATAPMEPVRHDGSEIAIDIDQLPLPQAVALLARATGSEVSGTDRLRAAGPVTTHLRTADIASAWQHLLLGRARFSTSCTASACRVWIGGAVAAPAPAPVPEAAPPPADGGNESQPDGSC